MHILVCSPGWPTSKTIDFVFVEQLCQAFANLGLQVTVIAPQSVTKCLVRRIPLAQRHYEYLTKQGNKIEVFRPLTISLGGKEVQFKIGTFENAIFRSFRRIKTKPDIMYGHFWGTVFSLFPLAQNNSIPLFGASGEENVAYYVHQSQEAIKKVREYISGVVSVSLKNQAECISLQLVDKEKSVVIPNAIDRLLFRKMDKAECRRKHAMNDSDFVVAFVGQFVHRKGTLRLDEALKRIGDKSIKAVFIGSGSEDPSYEGIIHKGSVAHDDVPVWLNAADVFALPTENEGCCNAIIEAMACGLPVISTDAPFNYDILNGENSIMVDCHDIDGIASAIRKLKDDKNLKERLSKGALTMAEGLSISRRAERIVEFIQKQTAK